MIKLLKKINSKKDKKTFNNNINILNFNSKFKNDNNKQIFRILNFEKNNNHKESQRCPYLINYYKNNSIDEQNSKRSPIHINDDKKYLISLNPKILENKRDKNRFKKVFPNLAIKKY